MATAGTEHTTVAAGAAGAAESGSSGTSSATGAAVAEQPAVAADTTNAAVGVVDRRAPAGPPNAAIAVKPPARSARTASSAGGGGRSGPAGPTHAAIAQQAGGPAGPASRSDVRAIAAVAAIAQQPPAGPAGCADGSADPVGAVADQRAPGQCQEGLVDQVEQILLDIGGLGPGICGHTRIEALHKLGVKRRDLGAQRLVLRCVLRKQRRNSRRDLVGTGRQQARGGHRCRGVGRAYGRTDARQIRYRRGHYVRHRDHKRHLETSISHRDQAVVAGE
ncbi:hypothetical protein LAUMK136_02539 [Mycobacterium attenuatum]|uniref:Uncharacterized protein n=1 Tax=Mycobacterium attenuatum TaxID=2341086 RepID=A0A498Q1U3_9MYCO|nr:hypothetical protein LAUMK136_02539 [Mycobacterium attenuatum]